MANYTAKDIKELRERTGAGMLDVKKALDEADGDQQKALEIIRVKGLKGVSKREGRATAEGIVVGRIEGQKGYLVEVNSETDFVAKAEPFVAFGEKVMDAAVAVDAQDLDTLLAAEVDGQKVSDLVTETGALLGEKVVVRRIARVEASLVELYLHRTSKDLPAQVGVLLAVDGQGAEAETAAHDVAVHIAALSPNFLTREDVPRGRDRSARDSQPGGQGPGRRQGVARAQHPARHELADLPHELLPQTRARGAIDGQGEVGVPGVPHSRDCRAMKSAMPGTVNAT